MDLTLPVALSQTRLTKSEWDALEVPVNSNTKLFLSFLVAASKDKEKTVCSRPTLAQYTKLSISDEVILSISYVPQVTYG